MTRYVLTAKAGDCTVYAEQRKTVGRAQVTDRREDAIVFDERDVARFPTLIRFWNAITGLQFETVVA